MEQVDSLVNLHPTNMEVEHGPLENMGKLFSSTNRLYSTSIKFQGG